MKIIVSDWRSDRPWLLHSELAMRTTVTNQAHRTDKEATKGAPEAVAQHADKDFRTLLMKLASRGELPDGVLLVIVGDDDCDVRLTVFPQEPERAVAVLEQLKCAVSAAIDGLLERRKGGGYDA